MHIPHLDLRFDAISDRELDLQLLDLLFERTHMADEVLGGRFREVASLFSSFVGCRVHTLI